MKATGYYWCSHCDQNAGGGRCYGCGRPGQWRDVVLEPAVEQTKYRELNAAITEIHPAAIPAASGARIPGAEWFRLMRENIAKQNP